MISGVEDSVTQGGSRCAPLPWAILALPLRGGRSSLLTPDADSFRVLRVFRGYIPVAVGITGEWNVIGGWLP